MNILDKYRVIVVDISDTILTTLKVMESQQKKLLIVSENNEYKSLVSIGDIQRAIIANIDITSPIKSILRTKIRVAKNTDSIDDIKKYMLETHNEFMPILSDGKLVDIVFLHDISSSEERAVRINQLSLPVVIMAGGKGSRLAPITNVLPKPLIPIGEKTIIEDIMDRFVSVGCNNFYISVNYKAEILKYYLDGLHSEKYKLFYFQEENPSGTAGSLSLLKGRISTTFFVSNCDIIIDEDYSQIYKYHKENKNEITLVAAMKYPKIPYGTITTKEDGLLDDMQEKPEFVFKINAGLYIIEPHLLDEIPKDKFFHITELISKLKSENRRVGVFPVSESSWVDMGSWEEYRKFLK